MQRPFRPLQCSLICCAPLPHVVDLYICWPQPMTRAVCELACVLRVLEIGKMPTNRMVRVGDDARRSTDACDTQPAHARLRVLCGLALSRR